MTCTCRHCGEVKTVSMRSDCTHWQSEELCCDCFDLAWGIPLAQLNSERAARGAAPLSGMPMPKAATSRD